MRDFVGKATSRMVVWLPSSSKWPGKGTQRDLQFGESKGHFESVMSCFNPSMHGIFTYIWLFLMATVGKYTGPMDGMGTKTSTSRPTFETCHRVPYKLPTIAGHQFQHQGQGNRFFSPVRFFRSTLGDRTNVERELNRDMGINCDLNKDIFKVSFGYSHLELHFELWMNLIKFDGSGKIKIWNFNNSSKTLCWRQ